MEILSTVLDGLYKLGLTMIGHVAHEHISHSYNTILSLYDEYYLIERYCS